MGGMLAATFLAIFFVPMFFRLGSKAASSPRNNPPAMSREVPCEASRPELRGHPPKPVRVEGQPLRRSFIALAVLVALAGCAVIQPTPPQLDLPAETTTAADNALLARWWTEFNDPVLTALVDEAIANNLDLKGSLARIEAARALLLLAQSNLYRAWISPLSRATLRAFRVGNLAAVSAASAVTSNFSVGLGVSYELDLWGKYRSGALAAANDNVAARYDREAVRITVAGDVATAYFRMRAADALLVVLNDTLKARTDAVKLQRDRYDGGLIGELRSASQAAPSVRRSSSPTSRAPRRRSAQRSPRSRQG